MKPLLMIAAVATSALLVVPTVAQAETATDATVARAHVDLSGSGNHAQLHARIDRAISQLCAEPGMRGISRMAMERPCIASARANLGATHLALTARARSPRA
jgi:UrcA family protein